MMAVFISISVVCFVCIIQSVRASYTLHQTPPILKRDMHKKDILLQQQPPSIYHSNNNPTPHIMPSTLMRVDRNELQLLESTKPISIKNRILHMIGLPHEHEDSNSNSKNNNDAVPDLNQYSWQDYLHPDHELKTNMNTTASKGPTDRPSINEEQAMHRYSFCGEYWTDARDNCQFKQHCEDDRDCPESEYCWTQTPCDYYATSSPTTAPPSISPPPSPTIGTDNIAIHTGPHFQDETADDEYYTNANDDPILPDNYNPQYGTYGNDYTRDDTDFREFVAFVGWYAFLIICCLLPTFCAYYRRRRSARALRDNLTNIQERLAEIESRRNEEDNTLIDLNGDNRDRDWEYLESLFDGPERSGDNEEAAGRRRIMGDIMGSVGIRVLDIMERDLRRRKEKGRRMVAVLKETSLKVQECHLVTKEDAALTHCLSANVDGDIEMGRLNMDTEKDIDKPVEAENKVSINHTKSESADSNEQSEPEPLETDTRQPTEDKEDGYLPDEPQSHPSPDDNNQDTTTAVAELPPPKDPPPILSSLYQVDDPYVDSDDEDNKHTLCIPCTNPSDTSPTPRVVPNSCIICLNSYEPGCYVSWSSDKECCHVFHRDCILMWLLKKDEPLCPCCRREFIPEALLNGDNVDEEDESETDINLNDLENGNNTNNTPTQTEQRAVTPRWDTLSVTAASLSSRGLPMARPF